MTHTGSPARAGLPTAGTFPFPVLAVRAPGARTMVVVPTKGGANGPAHAQRTAYNESYLASPPASTPVAPVSICGDRRCGRRGGARIGRGVCHDERRDESRREESHHRGGPQQDARGVEVGQVGDHRHDLRQRGRRGWHQARIELLQVSLGAGGVDEATSSVRAFIRNARAVEAAIGVALGTQEGEAV